MTIASVRLGVASALFVGWLGYLGYLALLRSPPIVLSRTQLMNATSWVVAEVAIDESGKPGKEVRIEKVYAGAPLTEATVRVWNLPEAVAPPHKPVTVKGLYLIPLKQGFGREFVVASVRSGDEPKNPVIYPWVPEVEQQLSDLKPAGR